MPSSPITTLPTLLHGQRWARFEYPGTDIPTGPWFRDGGRLDAFMVTGQPKPGDRVFVGMTVPDAVYVPGGSATAP